MRDIKFQYIYELLGVACRPTLTLEQIEEGLAAKDSFPSNAKIIAKRQCTGIKDCNGVEIYEGDIVSVQYDVEDKTIHTVEWGSKSYPAFELMPQLDCECNGFAHYYEDPDTSLEVIGNIHESPELLSENK